MEHVSEKPNAASWMPADAKTASFHMLNPLAPLSFVLDQEEPAFRMATDEELKAYLIANPYFCQDTSYEKVAEFFADTDGVILSNWARHHQWLGHEKPLPDETQAECDAERREVLTECIANICNQQAVTRMGAGIQLEIVLEHYRGYLETKLTTAQIQKLIGSALHVMRAPWEADSAAMMARENGLQPGPNQTWIAPERTTKRRKAQPRKAAA